MVGSPEPLTGFYYDHEKMELVGLTADGRIVQPAVTYSQTQYEGQSGKEKVIARIQDKDIRDTAALMRCLSSSFDLIIGIDTNTKTINGERISVSSVVHCCNVALYFASIVQIELIFCNITHNMYLFVIVEYLIIQEQLKSAKPYGQGHACFAGFLRKPLTNKALSGFTFAANDE